MANRIALLALALRSSGARLRDDRFLTARSRRHDAPGTGAWFVHVSSALQHWRCGMDSSDAPDKRVLRVVQAMRSLVPGNPGRHHARRTAAHLAQFAGRYLEHSRDGLGDGMDGGRSGEPLYGRMIIVTQLAADGPFHLLQPALGGMGIVVAARSRSARSPRTVR